MVKIFVRVQPDAEGVFRLDRDFKKRLTRVMRLQTGDRLEVFGAGNRWECELSRILPDGVELTIVELLPAPPAPKLHITLAHAIPKGDRFEWLIQKATEIGVNEIIPLITKHSVVRPTNVDAKLQRWNEIAEHAAGQSENAYPLIVQPPATLHEFLRHKRPGTRLLLHEREGARSLRETIAESSIDQILVAIGPEGGWAVEEVDAMLSEGFAQVHIGQRILRAETAGIVVASILQYELGDFAD